MSLVVSDLDPILYRQKYFYIDKPGLRAVHTKDSNNAATITIMA